MKKKEDAEQQDKEEEKKEDRKEDRETIALLFAAQKTICIKYRKNETNKILNPRVLLACL
jgi:hypothetical protein